MRFLIDVCASSHRMRNALIYQGHDVVSALEIDPRATDETLLATALEEQRTIITEDKDFGELVFVRRLDHPCIIRFVEMPVEDKVSAMEDLIENHGNSMGMGALIVVTRSRVRIRHPEQDRPRQPGPQ